MLTYLLDLEKPNDRLKGNPYEMFSKFMAEKVPERIRAFYREARPCVNVDEELIDNFAK